MNMVDQQMPFFHLALAVLGQTPQHLPEISAQLSVDHFLSGLRDEHDVILACPLRVV